MSLHYWSGGNLAPLGHVALTCSVLRYPFPRPPQRFAQPKSPAGPGCTGIRDDYPAEQMSTIASRAVGGVLLYGGLLYSTSNTSVNTSSTYSTPGSTHFITMSSTVSLTPERAEQLVRLLTDGLVNIVDESGQFLLKCESQRSFESGKGAE
jgi:hypothetical protein